MKTKMHLIRTLSDIVSACPYTIVGRKVLGKKEFALDKCKPVATQKEQQIIQTIKLGRNIALIGIFCPFFWVALFSGAARDFVFFNAMHSGVVIAIGGLILVKGQVDLMRYRKQKEPNLSHRRSNL